MNLNYSLRTYYMVKKAVIPLLPFCYFFFKLKRQKGRVGWLTTRGRSRSCSIWIKLDTRHRNSQQFQLSIVLLRLAHFHLKNLPQKTPKKIEFKRKKKWENLIQPPSLSSFWLTRFPPLGQIVVQWSSSELPHQEKPPIVTAEVPIFNYCLWLYHACYFAQLTNPSSSSTSLPSFGSLCWIRVRVGLDSLSCSSFFFSCNFLNYVEPFLSIILPRWVLWRIELPFAVSLVGFLVAVLVQNSGRKWVGFAQEGRRSRRGRRVQSPVRYGAFISLPKKLLRLQSRKGVITGRPLRNTAQESFGACPSRRNWSPRSLPHHRGRGPARYCYLPCSVGFVKFVNLMDCSNWGYWISWNRILGSWNENCWVLAKF